MLELLRDDHLYRRGLQRARQGNCGDQHIAARLALRLTDNAQVNEILRNIANERRAGAAALRIDSGKPKMQMAIDKLGRTPSYTRISLVRLGLRIPGEHSNRAAALRHQPSQGLPREPVASRNNGDARARRKP